MHELREHWRFYLCLALILGSNILVGAQAYDNTHNACVRGNILRSVVFLSDQRAAAKKVGGAGLYRREVRRLKSVPTTDSQGAVNCDVLVRAPWYVP